MGQKLVTVKFQSGSTPNLWSPDFSPTFKLNVWKSGQTPVQVQSYYPDLTEMTGLPVSLGTPETLTSDAIQSLIRNQRIVAFLVDDSITNWGVWIQENVLAPEGETLVQGHC